MNKLLVSLTTATLLFLTVSPYLIFPSEGLNDNIAHFPFLHMKKVLKKEIPGNSFVSSKHLSIIADGLNSYNFPSVGFASLLTNKIGVELTNNKDFLQTATLPQIKEKIAISIHQCMKDYRNKTKEVYQGLSEEHAADDYNNLKASLENLVAGGSMLSGVIPIKSADKNNVVVFQTGDSMTIVFSQRKYKGTEKKLYLPLFITKQGQKEFEKPFHFSTNSFNEIEDHIQKTHGIAVSQDSLDKINVERIKSQIKMFKLDLLPTDIILTASSGFFENLSIPMITFFMNYVLRNLEYKINNQKEIKDMDSLLLKKVDEFVKFAASRIPNYKTYMYDKMQKNQMNRTGLFEKHKQWLIEEATEKILATQHPTPKVPNKIIIDDDFAEFHETTDEDFQDALSEFSEESDTERNNLMQELFKTNKDGHKLKANERILTILEQSNCGLKQLMAFPEITNINGLMKIKLSSCLIDHMEQYSFGSNVLPQARYDSLSQALGGAAEDIQDMENLVSPYSLKAWAFGKDILNTKEDDVTVVVNMIGEEEGPFGNDAEDIQTLETGYQKALKMIGIYMKKTFEKKNV